MTDIIRLSPTDPLPAGHHNAILIRRFGEDDPNAIVTELDFYGAHPVMLIAVGPAGAPVEWEDAVQTARHAAGLRGYARLYTVDRTAGLRAQAVLAHGGDHSIFAAELSDTDEADGVRGATLLDAPRANGRVG